MQIDYGTPLGFSYYLGNGTTLTGGGYAGVPIPPATFPATLDLSGATGVQTSGLESTTNPNGYFELDVSPVLVFASQAFASAYLATQISANPGQPFVVGWPAPSAYVPSYNYPARALNSGFQVSTTRDAEVVYGVDISVTSLLITGAQGTVSLQYADDSGFTTNLKTVCAATNSNAGVLSLTNVNTATLQGRIPAGKWVRLLLTTVSGSPTFTLRSAQEVLL